MTFLRCLVVVFLLGLLPREAAAEESRILLNDNFSGVMTALPDGQRLPYPDRETWAFTFWPGSAWPDSYGDGTNWLEGNGESQTYLSPFIAHIKGQTIPPALRYNPFSIEADGLHIKAAPLTPAQQTAYQVGGHRRFGSGLLRSKLTFTYGNIRMIAKLPSARGSWPAFWLLPQARIWPPEIDVFEGMAWGPHAEQIHFGLLTPKGEPGGYKDWIDLGVDPSKDFHEYGLIWTPETITLLFDGRIMVTRPTPASMHQPMYLLINLAVGGKWAYNELGIRPIDSKTPERLARGADLIEADYPAEMIVKSVSVRAQE